jgi:membrane protein DedA with SNARE-associated domain
MFDWITGLVEQTGYLGIALLMLAENVFPPIPSELIMPMAGFAAARGELALVGVLLAGTAGSLAGALFWYHIGRRVGLERLRRWAGRHGRWLTTSPEELDGAAAWFDRHCGKAVLVGRLIPAVRTLISVPAGVAGMPVARFLAYSAAGTALWTALLAAAGYLLEDQYRRVGDYLNPVSDVILGLIVLGYLYRVATFRRRAAH